MLGKTHITTGIASALIITHPDSVSGVIATMIGGAIGGWIVDIDTKKMDVDREKVYDTIINSLFIGALIAIDFLIGKGMCKYIIDNWGIKIWIAFAGFLILMILGFMSSHHTFTHSFLGIALFGISLYYLCRPIALAFVIGYASHLVLDLFNKRGQQLLFPIRWYPCFGVCAANEKPNDVLFWIAFALDVILGAFLFASAMMNSGTESQLIDQLMNVKLLGMNSLQLYLVLINVLTFLLNQYGWKNTLRQIEAKEDKAIRIGLEFEIWLRNFFVFMGGGLGVIVSDLIHLSYPAKDNGNTWAFSYASILFWGSVYSYICDPFNFSMGAFELLSIRHLPIALYTFVINAISFLVFFLVRKRRFREDSPKHMVLWIIGAIGGTIGGFLAVKCTHEKNYVNYATIGFPIMLISQIVFVMYMMSVGVF